MITISYFCTILALQDLHMDQWLQNLLRLHLIMTWKSCCICFTISLLTQPSDLSSAASCNLGTLFLELLFQCCIQMVKLICKKTTTPVLLNYRDALKDLVSKWVQLKVRCSKFHSCNMSWQECNEKAEEAKMGLVKTEHADSVQCRKRRLETLQGGGGSSV